jgi:hypothetical protein
LESRRVWKSRQPTEKEIHWGLINGKPISSKDQRPQVIGDAYPTLAGDADREFFIDFAEFGNVINGWLSDEHTGSRWRKSLLGLIADNVG